MKKKRVHLEDYKNQNKQKVFSSILEAGRISRTNIAKATSLSSASVTLIVDELIKQKYVKEAGKSATTGGRAQKLLSVNEEIGSNITFYIDDDFIIAGKVSVFLETEDIITRTIKRSTPEDVLYIIEDIFKRWNSNNRIFSVSIGVRSPIEFKNTRVSISTSISMDFITIYEALRFMLGVPIIIERAVNFAALGESHDRIEKEKVYYLNLDQEIQLGGYPFVSEEHVAHMKVGNKGDICTCGKTGCLTTFVSSQKVLEALKNDLDNPDITWHLITESYQKGDEDVKNILDNVTHYLGKGIVNISTLINPALIIIGGDVSKLNKKFEDNVGKAVRSYGYYHLENMKVVLSNMGEKCFLIGGAKTYLLNVFQLNYNY